jgi:hypothetical protein
MLVPIIPLLLFLAVLLLFAWWMDTRGSTRVEHRDKTRRRVSFFVGAVVIAVVFQVVFPIEGISGGGLLVVAAFAYAAGIAAAFLVRPAAKRDLLLWVVLAGVTIVGMSVLLSSAIALLDSEVAPAR